MPTTTTEFSSHPPRVLVLHRCVRKATGKSLTNCSRQAAPRNGREPRQSAHKKGAQEHYYELFLERKSKLDVLTKRKTKHVVVVVVFVCFFFSSRKQTKLSMLSMQSSQKLNELCAYLHMCGLVPCHTISLSPVQSQQGPTYPSEN